MTSPTDQTLSINRQGVRAFVQHQRALLEQAQAAGSLARTKLDIKDAAERYFDDVPPEMRDKFMRTLDEELEAFCADLRLATVTVQSQVERVVQRKSDFWQSLFLAILIIVAIFFVLALIGSQR